MDLQMSSTSPELGRPQGVVFDGKPLPLSPLLLSGLFFLLMVVLFVFSVDAYLDGEQFILLTLVPSGVILLAISVWRGPYVLEALVRSRFTVELYARGFTVRRGRAVQAITYGELETLRLVGRALLRNGNHIGWLRTVEAHARGVTADFTVFVPGGQQDPGAELIDRLFAQAEKAVEERRKAGGKLRGDGWTLDAEGLWLWQGASVVALSELREAGTYQGQVSLWRGTEEKPFLSVPVDGPNAYLLLALARNHRREQVRTQQATQEATQQVAASPLGRLLFEKSREGKVLVLLALPALLFGVLCLFSKDEGVRVAAPFALGIGAFCAFFGAMFFTNSIKVHERGLVRRRTFFAPRTLFYTDIQSFGFMAVRVYRNGVYQHTSRSMVFVPQEGKPIRFTTDQEPDIDTDMDFLRDHIARTVADRLYQQLLEGGAPIPWGRNAWLGNGALSIRAKRREAPRLLAYSASIRFSLRDGNCFLFVENESKAVLALSCQEENFYPGLLLLQRLCSEAESRGADAPAGHVGPREAKAVRQSRTSQMTFLSLLNGRTIFIGIMVIVFGVSLSWRWLFDPAQVHLVVPSGRSIELSANGQPLTPKYSYDERRSFSLKQGDYTFRVKDKASGTERTYTLTLNSGFEEYVLPLDERQCFIRLDVSKWYGPGNSGRPVPLVDARISSEAPFSRNDESLGLVDLPQAVKQGRRVMLLKSVDCDALKKGDGALLSAAGFY